MLLFGQFAYVNPLGRRAGEFLQFLTGKPDGGVGRTAGGIDGIKPLQTDIQIKVTIISQTKNLQS